MTHNIEEIDELKAWYNTIQLPESIQIDKATYIPDLKKTIEMLFEQAYICYNNPRMQGCILLLKKIKAFIENKNE